MVPTVFSKSDPASGSYNTHPVSQANSNQTYGFEAHASDSCHRLLNFSKHNNIIFGGVGSHKADPEAKQTKQNLEGMMYSAEKKNYTALAVFEIGFAPN